MLWDKAPLLLSHGLALRHTSVPSLPRPRPWSHPRHGAAPPHRLLCAPPPGTPRRVVAGQANLEHPELRPARAPRPGSQLGRQAQARPPARRSRLRRAHARRTRATRAQEAEVACRCGEGARRPGPCGEGFCRHTTRREDTDQGGTPRPQVGRLGIGLGGENRLGVIAGPTVNPSHQAGVLWPP